MQFIFIPRLHSSLDKVEGSVLFLQSKITESLGGSGYNTERLATPYVPQYTGKESKTSRLDTRVLISLFLCLCFLCFFMSLCQQQLRLWTFCFLVDDELSFHLCIPSILEEIALKFGCPSYPLGLEDRPNTFWWSLRITVTSQKEVFSHNSWIHTTIIRNIHKDVL